MMTPAELRVKSAAAAFASKLLCPLKKDAGMF